MNKSKINLKISGEPGRSVLLSVFLLPMVFQDVHAYIDPGTGSLMIQLIIASLVGAAFMIKIFWRRIKAFFNNRFSKARRSDD